MFGSPFVIRHQILIKFIEEILSADEINEIYKEADEILEKGKKYETKHLTYQSKRRSEGFFTVTNKDLEELIKFINKNGDTVDKKNKCYSAQIKYITGNVGWCFDISSENHQEVKSINGCEDCPEISCD